MNTRKPLFGAAILSLAISIPILAGEVQTPTVVTPPPPTTNSSSAGESQGVISPAVEQGASDATTDLLLDLLVDMLSLY